MHPCAFLVTRGHGLDNRFVSNTVGNRLLILFVLLFNLYRPVFADLIQLMHKLKRHIIRLVQLVRRPDSLPGLRILLCMKV